jgi:hypothetical protein
MFINSFYHMYYLSHQDKQKKTTNARDRVYGKAQRANLPITTMKAGYNNRGVSTTFISLETKA